MSLGFNQTRKRRTSTLPGVINAGVAIQRNMARTTTIPSASVVITSAPVPDATRRIGSKRRDAISSMPPSVMTSPPKNLTSDARTMSNSAVSTTVVGRSESTIPLSTIEKNGVDSIHIVYATVGSTGALRQSDGTVMASADAGTRVVLVYPMMADTDDGIVTMRMKSVNPVTGQLTYTWVRVYDPNTETRYVTDFSLVP